MLRLDLNDKHDTVLFVNPMNGVKINKQKDPENSSYVLIIDTGNIVCYLEYDVKEYRDANYGYALNKINEYLSPNVESVPLYKEE